MPITEGSCNITATFLGLGGPSRTEAWFALGVGWKKLPQFSAAQQSPFLTKKTGREESLLESLTVHTLRKVVSRLSRREVRQKHGGGVNGRKHLFLFSPRKIMKSCWPCFPVGYINFLKRLSALCLF